MNSIDPSSAHEKAAVALRFKKARRKYLDIWYTLEPITSWAPAPGVKKHIEYRTALLTYVQGKLVVVLTSSLCGPFTVDVNANGTFPEDKKISNVGECLISWSWDHPEKSDT